MSKTLLLKNKQEVQGLQTIAFSVITINDEHKKSTVIFIIF